jgi:hypothetical protein
MEKSRTSETQIKSSLSPKEQMDEIVANYLASNPVARMDGKTNEVEVRFGTNTRKHKPLTKIDYDNVVKRLYSSGFDTTNSSGVHSLRIFHEYIDKNSGMRRMSNIRTEVNGVDLIQEYCKSNSLQTVLDMPSTTYDKLTFIQKSGVKLDDGSYLKYADFEDFNMRVAYQLEQSYTARSGVIRSIVQKWSDSKKTFRHLNRVRFSHDDLPVFADLSIVQKSKTSTGVPMKFYTVQDAGLFDSPETYEIELELDNTRIGIGTEYNTVKSIVNAIRKCVRIIMSGLQGTNYPISYSEQFNIQSEYMRLVHGPDYEPTKLRPRDFIGPSSYTLQIPNIMEQHEDSLVPNISNQYTVTEKADGDRMLLFINGEGKIYMINTNLSVIFTGAKTTNKNYYNSLIDGEHIKTNKHDETINLYAAFDIYYINKQSTREFEFYSTQDDANSATENNEKKNNETQKKTKFDRLGLLKEFISGLNPQSVIQNNVCCISIMCKKFQYATPSYSIFNCCSKIISDIEDGLYIYNTDGLIFTPAKHAVGGNVEGTPGPLTKSTWEHSFKWKPVEFNTIDFLVSIKKNKSGKDETHNIFNDGVSLEAQNAMVQYKTLILRCGYDERKHGFLNPCEDIIQNRIPNFGDVDSIDGYKAVPFQPTNPYDNNACYANILLKSDESNEQQMFTDEGEYFEEDMIVEFRYDITQRDGWKWVPLRVRYDKTTELRNGIKNYGNAYHVANSNWQSIHQPITRKMITTGLDIPDYIEECGEEENGEANEGVYYNRRNNNDKRTKSLRDFHNLYVKNKLIRGVSNRNDTLIDYAVGKAGDLSKWIYSNLSFVFGIDISRDNIQNRMDGACARYLKYRKTMKRMPDALFVNGNSGNLIRNGDALLSDKDKEITKAIFGNGPKDSKMLGPGVYKQYGVASDGFNISSCQFALHYFFDNRATLHRFVRNLAECTKLNGYFVGTCYDGQTVFNILRNKNEGESMLIMNGSDKKFELTKMYSQTGFQDDDTSIGYAINVFQDTIGKTFREYLVNFNYFIRIMEDYGFVVISKDEANQKGLPNGTGLFEELFNDMQAETRYAPRRKNDYKNAHLMTDDEKQISYMNRYFVFTKVRNVDGTNIYKNLTHKTAEELDVKTDPERVIIRRKSKKITITEDENK